MPIAINAYQSISKCNAAANKGTVKFAFVTLQAQLKTDYGYKRRKKTDKTKKYTIRNDVHKTLRTNVRPGNDFRK